MQGGYTGYPPHQHPGYTQQYAAPPGHPGAYNVSLCLVSCTRARLALLPAFRVGERTALQWPGFLTSEWAHQVPGGRGGAAVGRGQPVPHAMHSQAQNSEQYPLQASLVV